MQTLILWANSSKSIKLSSACWRLVQDRGERIAFKDPKRANSKCQSCSPVSEGEMAVTQGSPGKKFLPDLVLCCLFLAPKPVPLRDFGPGFIERTPSQRARLGETNLCRCNPECWKQRGWPPSSPRSRAAFSLWKSSNQWSPLPSCW